MKPESEIYEALLITYDIDPKETLFIDDLKENVEGAEKHGITCIHLTDPALLEDKLKELLITDGSINSKYNEFKKIFT